MTLKDTITKSLLEYPTLYFNSLDVYNHLFCTIGNGYEWKDGELVDKYSKNKVLSIKQAIQNIIDRDLNPSIFRDIDFYIDNVFNTDIEGSSYIKIHKNEYLKDKIKEEINLDIKIIKEQLSDTIKLIFDVEQRYKDFNLYTSESKRYKSLKTMKYKRAFAKDENPPVWKWHIYPSISLEHSYLCNFPLDIKADWAIAIDRMCWFLYTNLEEVIDQKYNENDRQKKNILACISKASDNLKEVLKIHETQEDEDWIDNWNLRDKKQSYLNINLNN